MAEPIEAEVLDIQPVGGPTTAVTLEVAYKLYGRDKRSFVVAAGGVHRVGQRVILSYTDGPGPGESSISLA